MGRALRVRQPFPRQLEHFVSAEVKKKSILIDTHHLLPFTLSCFAWCTEHMCGVGNSL